MPSGWEATGEVRWSSRWAASTRCVNLLLAKNPPCRILQPWPPDYMSCRS